MSHGVIMLLFVTQSFGFKHTVVDRKDDDLSLAERQVTEWGDSSKLYHVDCTPGCRSRPDQGELAELRHRDVLHDRADAKKWPVDDATLDYLFNDWVNKKGTVLSACTRRPIRWKIIHRTGKCLAARSMIIRGPPTAT